MSVKQKIPYSSGIFFITITNVNWLPLFEISNSYQAVYNFFDYLKRQGHFVNAYVIMPNHVHCIISFKKTNKNLNTIIGNGKRFMAYYIIDQLKANVQTEILNKLSSFVRPSDKLNGKIHEVFEPSFDWKLCEGIHFIQQKLDYIHNNPVKYKTPLCKLPEHFEHSSASFYYLQEHTAYIVDDIRTMWDANLPDEKNKL